MQPLEVYAKGGQMSLRSENMKLTNRAYWTPVVNMAEVECVCLEKFYVRADRAKIVCPSCRRTANIHILRMP